MKSNSLSFIVWVLYLAPLSISFGAIGQKPIDFPVSDIIILLIPALLLLSKPLPRRFGFAMLILSYFIFLAILGSVTSGGDYTNFLSGASFFSPTLHLLVGGILYSRFGFSFFRPAPYALLLIALSLVISDLLFGSFPRGCGTEGRWGGCLFGFDVYGFVNSSSAYLAIMSSLFSGAYFVAKTRLQRISFLAGLAIVAFIVPMSLSRSATLAICIVLIFFLYAYNWKFALLGTVLCLVFFSTALEYLQNTLIGRGLAARIEAGIQRGDITSGRFDIWSETIELIFRAPLFGYKFGYFSQHSLFGTAHNQFLEVAFKSGLIGFSIYFGFILYILLRLRNIVLTYRLSFPMYRVIMGGVFALLLTAITQPIMNYSVMGNVIFLLSGVALAISLKGPCETNSPRSLQRRHRVG
ncbi:O-antigen ligase family protein [Pelagerythrobacter marensis]|uniref:O-antigen ligase family protein n=1 Tax=Pelagerythrobacter marensis TaxID=543877 RepID=A0ABZ2D6U2_9SPHN